MPAYFDLPTSTWADSSPSPVQTVFAGSAWDASRDLAWIVDTNASRVHSFDPVADSWQSHAGGPPLGIDIAAAIAPEPDLLVITDTRSAARVVVFDLSTPDQDWFEVTSEGDAEILVGR